MPVRRPYTLRRLLADLTRIKAEHGDQVVIEMQRYDDIRKSYPVMSVHLVDAGEKKAIVLQ